MASCPESRHNETGTLFRTREGQIVSWSPAMERRYGISRDGAIGQDAAYLLGMTFPQTIIDINRAFDAQGVWRGGILARRQDGAPLLTVSEWHNHGNGALASGLVAEIHADPAGSLHDDDGRLVRDLLTVTGSLIVDVVSSAGLYLEAARQLLESADAADTAARASLADALDRIGGECRRGRAGIALLRDLTGEVNQALDDGGEGW